LIRRENDYYSMYTWVLSILKLAQLAEVSTLWCPVMEVTGDDGDLGDDIFHVNLGRTNIVENMFYDSFYSYYKMYLNNLAKTRRNAAGLVKQHDIIIVRTPSPIASLVGQEAVKAGKPLVLTNTGDMATQSTNVNKSKGVKKIFYFLMMKYFIRQEKQQAKMASLITTYSEDVRKRLLPYSKNVKVMMIPHLSEHDLFWREDTCSDQEIRILRVSWLLPAKGVEYLLEAFSSVLKKGYNIKLEIVGKEMYDGYQKSLEDLCLKLGVQQRVTFTGWVKFDELMSIYKRNDLQVVSSLAEGMPRCIVEGAANSLPLVATRVGGIPDMMKDEITALLVPSKDADSLSNAIIRMIEDAELRRRIIKNGFEFAKENTIEGMSDRFMNQLLPLTKIARV
jgi:glycosyltransferase involved in cell wall biosynthesis